jgi:hypothetical protein
MHHTERRGDRNERVLQERTHIPAAVLLVQHDLRGNFNSVLDKVDCTGQFNYGTALDLLSADSTSETCGRRTIQGVFSHITTR